MRVLIAEDEPIPRLILQSILENFGHACLVAEDGQEAWEVFQSTPEVDVVISDWMMPVIDGLELCRRIRAEKKDGYTYFIFLTALGDKGHLLEAMQEGADDYLSKPLDAGELLARVKRSLRRTAPKANGNGHGHAQDENTPGLSPREREILGLLAEGRTQGQIAGELVISSKTVATHIQHILAKLGVHTRAQAVAFAFRRGLVEPDVRAHGLALLVDR